MAEVKKESGKVIASEDGRVHFLPAVSAVITTVPKSKPTTPIIKPSGSSKVASWGENNDFPKIVKDIATKNTVISRGLADSIGYLYAGGVIYGQASYDDSGKEVFKPLKDPEIEAFIRFTNLKKYLLESITDFYWFYNPFPELILTADRKKIAAISEQDAYGCRWGIQNPKTGLVDKCYINANFSEGENETSERTVEVDVLDPYFDRVNTVRESKYYKFIYPLSYPTPGHTYYQLAPWDSARQSGWLDLANSIPQFKKALLKNQLSIKYHIKIADYFWEWKYPDWVSKPELRKERMEETFSDFNNMMTGEDNAGKSLFTSMMTDKIAGKQYPGWEITPIDDKIKDGIYIEDSNEASSHLITALGLDIALFGISPGKGMGAGSGSDKRMAYNTYIMKCQAHQDIILEPLEFISDYNGWTARLPGLEWRFKNTILTTLDQGSSMKQIIS